MDETIAHHLSIYRTVYRLDSVLGFHFSILGSVMPILIGCVWNIYLLRLLWPFNSFCWLFLFHFFHIEKQWRDAITAKNHRSIIIITNSWLHWTKPHTKKRRCWRTKTIIIHWPTSECCEWFLVQRSQFISHLFYSHIDLCFFVFYLFIMVIVTVRVLLISEFNSICSNCSIVYLFIKMCKDFECWAVKRTEESAWECKNKNYQFFSVVFCISWWNDSWILLLLQKEYFLLSSFLLFFPTQIVKSNG